MSAFADAKSDFMRDAARNGWSLHQEVSSIWRQTVPQNILARWMRQFTAQVEIDADKPRRLLNHYMLGADPEFCFITPGSDTAREDARNLGFRAALAWGADNNGRLAEIRPQPSRSALAVTASVWSTLHWMSKLSPATLNYAWRSGAYLPNDGLGGHIHFGRKRPTVDREVQALDTLAFYMYHSNIFNQREGQERIRRTAGHGGYGQLGDRRQQIHGWEYRTLPSWLDSPWLAYFTLTLGKLVVFDPDLVPQLQAGMDSQSASTVLAKLKGILAYYKGRDDDAAFAHQILMRHGFPRFDISDFAPRWGILKGNPSAQPPPRFTHPPSIAPNQEVITEIAQAMLMGFAPEWPDAPPTWHPASLPEGFFQYIHKVETYHHPGIGELVRDLVGYEDQAIRIGYSSTSQIDIPNTLSPGPSRLGELLRRFPDVPTSVYTVDSGATPTLYLPAVWGTERNRREACVSFLTAGWAPIWKAQDVTAESFRTWEASRIPEAPRKPARPLSQALFPPKPPASKRPSISLQTATERLAHQRRVSEVMAQMQWSEAVPPPELPQGSIPTTTWGFGGGLGTNELLNTQPQVPDNSALNAALNAANLVLDTPGFTTRVTTTTRTRNGG